MEGHHSKNDRNLRPPTRILERVSCDFGDLQGHIYIYIMYVYVYVYLYVSVYLYVHVYLYIYIYMYLSCYWDI